MMAQALAPTGALFTFIALWTGALLGPADVGHLLGVGRAHDLGAGPALPLLRLHRAAQRDRGSAPRRPRVRAARARRRGQHADHLFLGAVVEHAAPGRVGEPHRRRRWRRRCCAGMLRDGVRCWMYAIAVALVRVRAIILERERGAAWIDGCRQGSHELAVHASSSAMGGYGVLRLGVVRRRRRSPSSVEVVVLRMRAARRARALRAQRTRGAQRMKPRHRRLALDRAGRRRARRRGRARAERVPVEPRVLLHADAGRRERSAAGPRRSASAAWSRRQRQARPERASTCASS